MRKLVARVLRWQSKRLLSRVKPRIVVVAGSVGKTSTTQAITTILSAKYRVRSTIGNYNTDVGVPCSLFQTELPRNISNIGEWIRVFYVHEKRILSSRQSDFDVAVLELGTDKKGEITQFAWLKPDFAVVTAVAPEHMDAFITLDAVAEEELAVASFAKKTYANRRMVEARYIAKNNINWYDRVTFTELLQDEEVAIYGEHSKDAVAAAIVVSRDLGMDDKTIVHGVKEIRPQPGRMNKLQGVNRSIIIDDTYNASPEAVRAALEYVSELHVDHKIVLLGNMNELGSMSEQAHREIGALCDPSKLQMIATLGSDANTYLAEEAEKKGCRVRRFENPYDAGQAIKDYVESVDEGALVLCKGSQNGVFAEEAVKILLDNHDDVTQLVRQSPEWLAKKEKSFMKGIL